MQTAFSPVAPVRGYQQVGEQVQTCRRRRLPVPVCCATARAVSDQTVHSELLSALRGLNRGLDMDADTDAETEEESRVEDAIEALEAQNACTSPTTDDRRLGEWELAYTSSALMRFTGGLTGMQKFLPGGTVGRITFAVDGDDATWDFRETLSFEILGRELETDVLVTGPVEALNETREVWSPEKVRFYFFNFFAESWKSLRSFTNCSITYLDEDVKITRGTTGTAVVFVRPELADELD